MYENVGNILKIAKYSNTAVISFICMDFTMARSVICAAEAANTPVLVMLYPEHVTVQRTCCLTGYAAMVKELASEVNVPVGLHLDHDYSYESIINAVHKGFGSVMIDGSMNDLDTNIALTKRVVEQAHKLGALVEGEIGYVGVAANADNINKDLYTKPDAAEKFCRETGVDTLAVSIGNAHGEYKEEPDLDLKRLEEIHAATDVPLVLHGGSGIPDSQLKEAFTRGIKKLNLGTEFIGRYYDAVSDFVLMNGKNPDPVKMIHLPEFVQERLKPYAEERLKTLCRF